MKKEFKKKIRNYAISGLSITLLMGGVAFSNYRYNWINKTLDYLKNEVVEDEIKNEIISKGIKIEPLSSEREESGILMKTFSYTITPSNASIKEVSFSLSYVDGTSCEGIVDVQIDQGQQIITIRCLKDFDQEIVLKIYSTKWPEVFAKINLDYQEKVKEVISSEEIIYYDGIVDLSDNFLKLFTWKGTKHTISKTDYKFTISGGVISNIDTSKLYYPINYSSEEGKNFVEGLVSLTKSSLFEEEIKFGSKSSPYDVGITSENHLPSGEEIWNLTNDDQIHYQLVNYWENGRDQEIMDNSYVYFSIDDLVAKCDDGQSFYFSINIAISLVANYSNCYIPISSIETDISQIIF